MRGLVGLTAPQWVIMGAAAVAALVMAEPGEAQTRTFDVPAGPASRSLPVLARQAGIQILARSATVRSKRTNAVRGAYSVEEALRRLLRGTDLVATPPVNGIVIIKAVAREDAGPVPLENVRPREPPREDVALQDIIVTARHVSEQAQQTPMAVTPRSRSQLEAANVTDIGALGTVVPNLWTVPGDARSAGTPIMTMRGVRQGDSSSYAAPPAVAIYTDDVYHATTAGSDIDLADVDRIEVSRGPQSTLSGNASIGGSIRIYTRDPRGDGSGHLSLVTGSRGKFGAAGAVDLGLTPSLAIRLSGTFERQRGWVDRLDFTCEMNRRGTPELALDFPLSRPDAAARDCVIGTLGGIRHAIGQVKVRWQPNDRVDLVLNARRRLERDEETPELALAYQPNPVPNPNNVVEIYNRAVRERFGLQLDDRFLPPADDPYATYATNCRPDLPLDAVPSGFCFPARKSANHNLLSARLRYDLRADLRMTAIGAWTEYDNAFTTAGDQSPLGYTISHFENRARQKSAELRFDGTLLGGRLDWIFGGFWLRTRGYQDSFIGFISQTSFADDEARIESQSAFFHLDYDISEQWRVSGGARYTDGRIVYHFDHPPLLTVPEPFASAQRRWDWLLSTDYRIGDDIFVYASAASGSRPPGIVTIINTAEQFLPTPGEELISYEAGLKADLFGRRLRANLAAFYTDYRSLATSAVGVQCLGQPAPATWFPTRQDCLRFPDASFLGWNLPVGVKATVKGFEWEITALPVPGLRIDWLGGYNHYRSGVKTPGAPGYLWPGNHRQPAWNMHANASWDIGTPIGTFTPRLDWSWQSQQDFDTTSSVRPPLPIFVVKPYSIWNARIAYRSPGKGWSVTLAVTNLADKVYSYQKLSGTLNAQSRSAPPREFSLTVRRDF